MTEQELAEKYEKYTIQYSVMLDRENTKTILVKGQSVKNNTLIQIMWNLVPACYQNMRNKEGDLWQDYATYFRFYVSDILKKNEFWTESLKSDYIDDKIKYSTGKEICIDAVEYGTENGNDIGMVLHSDAGLYGIDYVYGICSIIKKTYSDLCCEDNVAAKWLKNSICEMIDMDSFWEEGRITETEMDFLKNKYADKPKLLS